MLVRKGKLSLSILCHLKMMDWLLQNLHRRPLNLLINIHRPTATEMWSSFFCFKLKFRTKVRFAEEGTIFIRSAHNFPIIGRLLVSEVSFQGVKIILAILCNKTNHVIFIKRFLIWKAPGLLRQLRVYRNFLYLNEWTWLSLNLNNHYWHCAPWFMSLLKCTLLDQVLVEEEE